MISSLKFIGNKEDYRKNFKLCREDKIGESNFGRIYKAKNLINDKIYAVKVFHSVRSMDLFMLNLIEVFELFRNGLTKNTIALNLHQIFAWIDEPSIDNIDECKEIEINLAIAIDYCNGGSLEEVINSLRNTKKKISNSLLEDYTQKLIFGINQLIFETKDYHKNIKPSNILINNDNFKIKNFKTCQLFSSSEFTIKKVIIINKIIIKYFFFVIFHWLNFIFCSYFFN